MKPTFHYLILAVMAPALAACSSTSSTPSQLGETTRSTTYIEGVPGGVLVETTSLNATVVAIDSTNRTVTLAVKDGRQKSIKCGPEVRNFDQIHTGDHVRAVITSELATALAGTGALPVDSAVAEVVRAPEGAKPGGVMRETQEYAATVTEINQRRREVTLRLPDDTARTLTVRPDIDLSQQKVGAKVLVRVSVAVAILVEKP